MGGETAQLNAPANAPAFDEKKIRAEIEQLFVLDRKAGYGGGYRLLGEAAQQDYINMCARVAKRIVGEHPQYNEEQKASVYFVAAVLGTGNARKFASGFLGNEEKGGDLKAQLEAFMQSANIKSEFARKYTAGNCATFVNRTTGANMETGTAPTVPVVAQKEGEAGEKKEENAPKPPSAMDIVDQKISKGEKPTAEELQKMNDELKEQNKKYLEGLKLSRVGPEKIESVREIPRMVPRAKTKEEKMHEEPVALQIGELSADQVEMASGMVQGGKLVPAAARWVEQGGNVEYGEAAAQAIMQKNGKNAAVRWLASLAARDMLIEEGLIQKSTEKPKTSEDIEHPKYALTQDAKGTKEYSKLSKRQQKELDGVLERMEREAGGFPGRKSGLLYDKNSVLGEKPIETLIRIGEEIGAKPQGKVAEKEQKIEEEQVKVEKKEPAQTQTKENAAEKAPQVQEEEPKKKKEKKEPKPAQTEEKKAEVKEPQAPVQEQREDSEGVKQGQINTQEEKSGGQQAEEGLQSGQAPAALGADEAGQTATTIKASEVKNESEFVAWISQNFEEKSAGFEWMEKNRAEAYQKFKTYLAEAQAERKGEEYTEELVRTRIGIDAIIR